MEQYSVISRKEASSHEKTWKGLKCIRASEGHQCEKASQCETLTPWDSGKGTTMETVKRAAVARDLEGGRNRWKAVKPFCMIL